MSKHDPADDDAANEGEGYDVSYVLESVGDGAPRLVRSIESHPDGTTIVTEYEDARPADDPYVRSRQRSVNDGPVREIVTDFVASPVRPRTYPAGFPFLSGRPSWTTESPAHELSPGARWPCNDPETVIAELVAACLADGWERVPMQNTAQPGLDVIATFTRQGDLREFLRTDTEHQSVIQMLDSPADW